MGGAGLHEVQPRPRRQPAVHHPHRRHDAAVLVELRVEDQRLERGIGIAARRRDPLGDRVQQLGDALAGLGRDLEDVLGGDAEHGLDLHRVAVGVGRRQVDLVEAGDDLEVVLERQIAVGECLRLDALGGVDHEHDTLACGQRAAHLVAEVDVTGRVDQVVHVPVPVDADVLGLDRDAALALEIHRVEILRLHVAGLDRPGDLEDAVGQRRLAMVDVGDDREIPDPVELHGNRSRYRRDLQRWG